MEMEGDKVCPISRRQRERLPYNASGDMEEVRVSSIKVFNMAKSSN